MMTTTMQDKRVTGGWVAKVQGRALDTITCVESDEWDTDEDADNEGYRYTVESEETSEDTDDDPRDIIATMIRDLRNAAIEEATDRLNDEVREWVENLIDAGRGAEVMKALRAAKVI